jgi:hypothetical protein
MRVTRAGSGAPEGRESGTPVSDIASIAPHATQVANKGDGV